MEQIRNYFEHMDYVSFGVAALPCVVIAVYGFLQVASGLVKCKNDKMQRCNQNGSSGTNNNNSNVNATNNINSSSSNNHKRCPQKYTNNNSNNVAASNGNMMAYQQHATSTLQHNGSKQSTRKSRYNSNKQQQQQQQQHFGNIQKRNGIAGLTGSESSPSPPTSTWLERGYGHRLANSSCIEDKFLGQHKHNPGHRNSTSSEATSEDIDSSREHLNKAKGHTNGGSRCNNLTASGNKSRSKRQQKSTGQQQQIRNSDQNGQKPAAATVVVVGQKTKQPNSKWRQQQQQQQQQQANPNQQQKRSSNKKSGKCASSSSSGGSSSSSNINKHGGNNQRKTCDSSSSSALSSPTSSPTSSPHANGNRKRIERSLMPGAALEWRRERERGRQNANFLVPPLRQYEQLDLDDRSLVQQLRRHVIDHHLLRVYGYPVESVVHEGAIEIFKCLPHMSFAAALAETAPAVTVINCHDGLTNRGAEEEVEVAISSDSGNSSPRSMDSESGGEWSGSECESSNSSSSSAGDAELSLELKYCQYVQVERSLAKPCARCKRHFLVDELTGQYLNREECQYHSGKYQRYYDGVCHGRWTCCNEGEESSPGCCLSDRHVWTGSVGGVNGPYYDFVRTQHRESNDEEPAVYALDCEMSYTGRGLDVTKVSLVALNGQLVYEHFVRPECDIIDYNTRYSGITERDLRSGAKTLAEVQRDLLELIAADTILIGHGLDNDLRALRLVHNTLIDTSISFPHCSGFPYRRALRHLTKVHLKREIQSGDGTTGHSSFEDSRACMELMLWRINREQDPSWSWDD
ncbi:myb-like protein A isoform X2 [Drosophila eugracilis]|uniref:myb-like protein A isoform X2 n=1 Tax=Drosophila eugracilis TaxID=29029 RepID=UPI0007E74C62|nr:myb-like protein A isoform X2 [Drosophila eugracilis]